jgi:hypothetical protein
MERKRMSEDEKAVAVTAVVCVFWFVFFIPIYFFHPPLWWIFVLWPVVIATYGAIGYISSR